MDNSSTSPILVIGDLMLDHYIYGAVTRISPEAPVPVVKVSDDKHTLGGALNVVNNLKSLGAEVSVIGVLGEDDAGKNILGQLQHLKVDHDGVLINPEYITIQKTRVMAAHQQILRYDREEITEPTSEVIKDIKRQIERKLDNVSMVVLSDYGKGILTKEICQFVIEQATKRNVKVLVDPKGNDYSKYKGAYLITPNKSETAQITGSNMGTLDEIEAAGKQLKKEVNLDNVVMTLGPDGMAIYDDGLTHLPTIAQEVYDVTGAGDTVIAAIAYSLNNGYDLRASCEFANAAAAVVVGKSGCAVTTLDEVKDFRSAQNEGILSTKFIQSDEQLTSLIDKVKASGKRIVFTNGCFDVLHAGHVDYLSKAATHGDLLILGLNSDDSVKRLKGEDRPVNSWENRATVLAGLTSVDYIVSFSDDTPIELIKKVKPQVLVKGADYKDQEVVGSEIAERTVLIELTEGLSTTRILEKLK